MMARTTVFEILDDKAQYVRRLPGEEYSLECLVKTVKHPTSIMVWSMMSVHGVGRLHIVEGRMNQQQYVKVLEKKLLPELPIRFPNGDGIFQQDGAPCHTARSVKAFLEKHSFIAALAWKFTGYEPICRKPRQHVNGMPTMADFQTKHRRRHHTQCTKLFLFLKGFMMQYTLQKASYKYANRNRLSVLYWKANRRIRVVHFI